MGSFTGECNAKSWSFRRSDFVCFHSMVNSNSFSNNALIASYLLFEYFVWITCEKTLFYKKLFTKTQKYSIEIYERFEAALILT